MLNRGKEAGNRLKASMQEPVFLGLALLIIAGFFMRVWGISFGLPHIYHPDEGFEVNRALQLASGSFDFTRVAKGGYFYVIFVEFGFLFVFAKLAGLVETTKDFALWFIRDPSAFYLIGRFTTAVIGTICVYLTFRVGERYHSRWLGLVAAIFVAFNSLHIQHSHYITVDMPLTTLVMASLLCMLKLLDSGQPRFYLWTGFFIALASMTKLPGVVLLVPFFIAHLVFQRNLGKAWLPAIFAKDGLLGFIVFLVVYVAGAPGIVIYLPGIVSTVFGLYGIEGEAEDDMSDEPPGTGGMEDAGVELATASDFQAFNFYLGATIESMGWPVFILSIIGLLYAARYLRAKNWVLISFVVTFFVLLALSAQADMAFNRYVLPFLPALAVLAAAPLVDLIRKLFEPRMNYRPVVAIIALAAVAPSFLAAIENNQAFGIVDSRTQAKNWIEEKVPAGATVLIEGFSAQVYRASAPILNSEENTREAIRAFRENGENGKAKYFQFELEARTGKRYDLYFYLWDKLEPLEFYLDEGIDWYVIRPSALLNSAKYAGIGQQFLDEVRNSGRLEMQVRFDGEESSEGTGPSFEIYKRVTRD